MRFLLTRATTPLIVAAFLLSCHAREPEAADADQAKASDAKTSGTVTLSAEQIEAAGIELIHPAIGPDGGTVEVSALVEADPQRMQVVSAAIGGRIVALNRNLGQTVRPGEVLAFIESREAAALKGEVEAASARAALARSNLAREQRLFAARVSPEQDLITARTAAAEAGIALRQARQQLSATGGGGGALNRVGITAPIAGEIINRSATLGQTVAADAELFRVANLSNVSLALSFTAKDAAHIRTGARVEVAAPGRSGEARISFISPALDPSTKLVPAIATLDNRSGQWRVGEPVMTAVQLPSSGDHIVSVPKTAVQNVDGKTVVFVRTATGFRMTPIGVGPSAGDKVIVLSGLSGTEKVAAANSFTLKSELGKSAGGDD
jgi:cobalt-zinc-cadmium efflux system membrane fusion protein